MGRSLVPQISNVNCTKSQNKNDSRLVLQLSLPNALKPGVENEDVIGVALTGDGSNTTSSLPNKLRLY